MRADKLYFPNDTERRRYYITGHEYVAAKELGLVQLEQIHHFTALDDTINFTPYVERFYAEKLEAKKNNDTVAYERAKFFLNTLYGKFGANPENYENHLIADSRLADILHEQGVGFVQLLTEKTSHVFLPAGRRTNDLLQRRYRRVHNRIRPRPPTPRNRRGDQPHLLRYGLRICRRHQCPTIGCPWRLVRRGGMQLRSVR